MKNYELKNATRDQVNKLLVELFSGSMSFDLTATKSEERDPKSKKSGTLSLRVLGKPLAS